MSWKIIYTKQAEKDAKKLVKSNLKDRAKQLIQILEKDPFFVPPIYKALSGDLIGSYSRRINIQHRLIYQVYQKEKTIKIIRMWSHYE